MKSTSRPFSMYASKGRKPLQVILKVLIMLVIYTKCESINGTVIKQIIQGNYTFDDAKLEIKITGIKDQTEIVTCIEEKAKGTRCVSKLERKSGNLKNQTLNTSHKKPADSQLRRAAGGSAADPNEFPFQVLFLNNSTGVHCGGTILEENFILTAAHCFYEDDGYIYDAEEYESWTIVAGDHNRQINEGTEQRRQILDVHIHEEYIPIAEINDMAIVKLDHPMNLSSAVQPILLPDADYEATGDAVVTGWGKVSYGGLGNPLILQKATVPIVDREVCRKAYEEKQVLVSSKMLCAGDVVKGGVDACQGDSGGPLSVKLSNGSFMLIGVVSSGIECARADYPGIYMQVSKYVDWISDTLNNFGNCSLHNGCLNGGACVDGIKSHTCICVVGYEGNDCAAAIYKCAPSNPCLNGGICVNGINSFTCTCADEFAGNDCQHVNQCRYPGSCKSSSAVGNCGRCRDGYVKDPEYDTRCKFGNSNTSLIISSREGIRMISLDGQKTIQMIQNRDFAMGTDHSFRTNTIFWFSFKYHKIYTSAINGESAKKTIFYDTSSWINGVAVDWIHQHLYWADFHRNEICVSNFNGTMKKVLLNDGLLSPLSIAVNPLNGWMYWSDRGTDRIERAGLDGSRREVILSRNIIDPQGLVVDFVDSRLYWSQGENPSSIWSSDFDGSHRKLIFNPNPSQFSSSVVLKVATFDKYVYFIENRSSTIYRVNKCDGKELEMVHKSKSVGSVVRDIKIYHATQQPEGKNLCWKRIGPCSHFCFAVPSLDNGPASTTTCSCPDGLSLSADQQNCG